MISKIPGKSARMTSPLEGGAYKTERTAVSNVMHWMRNIIEEKKLDLGKPDVETSGADRKMPDTVIYESRRSRKVLCVIEAKQPFFNVFDEKLKDEARKKANMRNAPYFATTNFRKLIWWKTKEANDPEIKEERQIVNTYDLSQIEDLNTIEYTRFSEQIKKEIGIFLQDLYEIYHGKKSEPKHAIDELLIFRLLEKIRILAFYYREIIDEQCRKDRIFSKDLIKWFAGQGWSFSWQSSDFDKVARQTAYLLINKILFYKLLRSKRPKDLDPLEIPPGTTKGAIAKNFLQTYFTWVLKNIDYETIYSTDFIDTVAFPEHEGVVEEIKDLVNVLDKYDFSSIGYDIIGRIFERLIPVQERHNLGQYFTDPDIVDLILKFCINHEDDKVLDPSCGAGTFLIRAYYHKLLKNARLEHEQILETLWGSDVAKFPAHLATINLAIRNLGVDRNYPNIIHGDFFNLHVGKNGFEAESWRKVRAKTLGVEEREVAYPRNF